MESYLGFLGRTQATDHVSRAVARWFFAWCHDSGLALEAINGGHISRFFATTRAEWKATTARIYFGALKRLFAHLEADHVLERSPFASVPRPAPPEPEPTLAQLKDMARAIDGYEEGSEDFNAMMVVLYPLVVGGTECERIAAFTGVPLEEVETYVRRLRANGCWTDEGQVAFDPSCRTDSERYVIEIILQMLCATGMAEIRSDDGAPPAQDSIDSDGQPRPADSEQEDL